MNRRRTLIRALGIPAAAFLVLFLVAFVYESWQANEEMRRSEFTTPMVMFLGMSALLFGVLAAALPPRQGR